MEIQKLSEIHRGAGKFLLYGPSGSGKTYSLATLPVEETIIINTERGLRTLIDIAPDVSVLMVDTQEQMREAYELANSDQFKYIAIDSLTKYADIILAEEMAKTRDARRAYMKMGDAMTKFIDALLVLDQTVIMIGQEQRVNPEQAGLFDYCYAPSVPGQKYAAKMPYTMDFIVAMRSKVQENGETIRKFQFGLHGDYLAKARSTRLDTFEDADWQQVFNKLKGE